MCRLILLVVVCASALTSAVAVQNGNPPASLTITANARDATITVPLPQADDAESTVTSVQVTVVRTHRLGIAQMMPFSTDLQLVPPGTTGSFTFSLTGLEPAANYNISVSTCCGATSGSGMICSDNVEAVFSTMESVPASAGSVTLTASVTAVSATITQPNEMLRNGIIGSFILVVQRLVPARGMMVTRTVNLASGNDAVTTALANLEEHSLYSVTVVACLLSNSSACSPPSTTNITTLTSGAVSAPGLSFNSSSSLAFESSLTITFIGSSIPVNDLNGYVWGYEAVLSNTTMSVLSILNTTEDFQHSLGETAPDSSVTFTGLMPNTMYLVQSRVYTSSTEELGSAMIVHGGVLSSHVRVITTIARPPSSFDGSVSIATQSMSGQATITVSFVVGDLTMRNGNVTHVVVRVLPSTNFPIRSVNLTTILVMNTATFGASDTDLAPGTNYTVEIQACNAAGCSDPTRPGSIVTVSEAPYQSSAGALATMVTANDVTVIFLPPSASARNGIITTYRFNIIRTVINGISSPQDFLVNSDQNAPSADGQLTFNFGNLHAGASYTVTVSACTRVMPVLLLCATNTTSADFTTDEAVPAVSSSMVTTAEGATHVNVSISPPGLMYRRGIITHYILWFTSPLTMNMSVRFNVSGSQDEIQNFTLTNLEEFQTYSVVISACTVIGCSVNTTSLLVTTLSAAPGQVSMPSVVTVTANTVQIRIPPLAPLERNGEITRYVVTAQRTVVSSVDVANEPDVMVAVNVTNQTLDTDYTIESLSAASVYLIVVKAMNELPQTGPGSQAVMATTTEAAPAVSAFSVTSIASSATTINVRIAPPDVFDRNGNITHYRLNFTSPLTGVRSEVFNVVGLQGATQMFVLRNLEEFQTYTILVSACTAVGCSSNTNLTSVRTDSSVPAASTTSVVHVDSSSTTVTRDETIRCRIGTPFTLAEWRTIRTFASVGTGSRAILYGSLVVPNGVVQNVNITNGPTSETGASVTAQFNPLLEIQRNSIISSYLVAVSGSSGLFTSVTVPSRGSEEMTAVVITGLSSYTMYNVSIHAVNSGNMTGPAATETVRTAESAPASSFSALSLTAGIQHVSVMITQPDVPSRNGIIGSFRIVVQRLVPFSDTSVSRTENLPADTDIVISDFNDLHEHSVYSVSVSACLRSDSSACSPPTSQNVTTQARGADSAPDVFFRTSSSPMTFESSIQVDFFGGSIPIDDLNGVVVVYEAILRDSSNVLLSSMNTTNILTHTLGGIAPNGSVTFTGLVPNTMFTVQSRAYTAFNSSTFAHAGNLSSLFPVMTPITRPSASFSGDVSITRGFGSGQALLTVSFMPPAMAARHGPLRNFVVNVTSDQNTGTPMHSLTIPAMSGSININFGGDGTDLIADTLYFITIQACNDAGCSDQSEAGNATTFAEAPYATSSSPIAFNASAFAVEIQFAPPGTGMRNGMITAFMFRIDRNRVNGVSNPARFLNEFRTVSALTALLSFRFVGLQPGSEYSMVVRACTTLSLNNTMLCATNQSQVTFNTLEAVPAASASSVVSSALSPTSANVFIFPPMAIDHNGIITHYALSFTSPLTSIRLKNFTAIGSGNDNQTFELTDLAEFQVYTINISACTVVGCSLNTASTSIQTLSAVPETSASAVSAIVNSPTSVNVTIDPPVGIDRNGIITHYNLNFTSAFTMARHELLTVRGSQDDVQMFELDSLEGFQNYSIVVSACTSVGCAPNTAGTFVFTPAAAPSGTVTNVMITNNTASRAEASLLVQFDTIARRNRNSVISRYLISVNDTDGMSFAVAIDSEPQLENISMIIGGFQSFTEYVVSIRAVNDMNLTGPAVSFSVLTDEAVPDMPESFAVSKITAQSAFFSWADPVSFHGIGLRYNFTLGLLDGVEVANANLSIMASNFTATNLRPYTSYNATVVASTVKGGGVEASLTFRSASTNPLPVSNMAVSSVDGNPRQALVEWISPPVVYGPITAYEVRFSSVKTISMGGRMVPLNDTRILRVAVRDPALRVAVNESFSATVDNLLGSSSYTFQVTAFVGNLAGTPSTTEVFFTAPQAPPTRSLPTGTVTPATLRPDVVASVAPAFDTTNQLAVQIPPADETNGRIMAYQINIAVGCNGQYSTAAPISYAEFTMCTACPCPPYIALYGSRENISRSVGSSDIAVIGSTPDTSSCGVICNAPLSPSSDYRVFVRAVTRGPTPAALNANIQALDTALATTVSRAVYRTSANLVPHDSGLSTGAIVGIILGVLIVAFAIAAFIYYKKDDLPGMHKLVFALHAKHVKVEINDLPGESYKVATTTFTGSNASLVSVNKKTAPDTQNTNSTFSPRLTKKLPESVNLLAAENTTPKSASGLEAESAISTNPGQQASQGKKINLYDMEGQTRLRSANDDMLFAEEFEQIKPVGTNQSSSASRLEANTRKNRYSNILAYNHSRVTLPSGVGNSDYINANFIHGHGREKAYIACQGPLPQTVSDFWAMIWDQKVCVIAMVTQLIERSRVKCHKYWPAQPNVAEQHGKLTVTLLNEDASCDDWHVRSIAVSDGTTMHKVHQLAFHAWPDHGVPASPDVLIRFIFAVRQYIPDGYKAPMCVHCSAGVGRTGTFICVDTALRSLETTDNIDIFGIVYRMRMQRNSMVQTEAQYIFIYKALAFVASKYLSISNSKPNMEKSQVIDALVTELSRKTCDILL